MFYSILYPEKENEYHTTLVQDATLEDLHLNSFFRFIYNEKKEYDLEKFYTTILKDKNVVYYRQEILKDLLQRDLLEAISRFSKSTGAIQRKMEELRIVLNQRKKSDLILLSRGKMLEVACTYIDSIHALLNSLNTMVFQSRGLKEFQSFLQEYIQSNEYHALEEDCLALRKAMQDITYLMFIRKENMRIYPYNEEENLTDEILACFDKFRQDKSKDYTKSLAREPQDANLEATTIELLSRSYPNEFKQLQKFCMKHQSFDNEILLRFSREIQFYIGWIEETQIIRESGLSYCFPSFGDKTEYAMDFYDTALAYMSPGSIVPNSIELSDKERIMVITGPNQGGKTTFTRAFGQLHYLAALGLDVPGTKAMLQFVDMVYTHFERQESIETLNGKLQEELERLYTLKKQATKNSLILINEIFASTTTQDAIQLGEHMMEWLEHLQSMAIVVTFLDDLSSYSPNIVSLMSITKSDENHQRAYKIIRKKADGHAFAMDIVRKYGLTKEDLERRLSK